jgi:hypothetical protein
MRKLMALLLAFGLLAGVAGTALANCGADHAGSSTPAPEQPKPQA